MSNLSAVLISTYAELREIEMSDVRSFVQKYSRGIDEWDHDVLAQYAGEQHGLSDSYVSPCVCV